MSPEAFWDMFYQKTSRKMITDAPAAAQTARPAAQRPSTPSSVALWSAEEGRKKKATWIWLDSDSSIDTPCAANCTGCANPCDERPYDADSSGVSSRDSLNLGSLPCLVVRGVPLAQQQQPGARVAGPVEANGRPPLLFEDSSPAAETEAVVNGASQDLRDQQEQQQTQSYLQASAGERPTSRRKQRNRRRRTSARYRR